MTQVVALVLVAAMIGLPLGIAHTEATIALAAVAGGFAVAGVLIRTTTLVTTGVVVSVVEALLAFLQGGQSPHVLLALGLGVIMYLLLDITFFFTTLHGVALDTSVWRMKAVHWGSVSALLGCVGLVIGLIAVALARPLSHPLLGQGLSILTAVTAVGAVLAVLRVWRRPVNDAFDER
jgi:hypothetical protein